MARSPRSHRSIRLSACFAQGAKTSGRRVGTWHAKLDIGITSIQDDHGACKHQDFVRTRPASLFRTARTDPRIRSLGRTGWVEALMRRFYRRAFGLATRLRNRLYTVALAPCFESFGAGSVIVPRMRVEGAARIRVEEEVFFGPGCWLNVPDSARGAGRLIIMEGCSLAGDCVLSSAQEVVLEREVLLARNVYIADHRHAFSDPLRSVLSQGIEGIAPVRICAGAWLGQNVVVLPGVRIGCGSVVGANSVVAEDVPDWCVAVGAPARVVRSFGRK